MLVLVPHGLIREEITQTLEPVVIMVVPVVVLQVTVEIVVTVVLVQDFLEMVIRLLEPHHLNEQDLTPEDQGVVVVQTVGAVTTHGAVLEAAVVLVLLAVVQEGTLAVAVEHGHLN